MDPTSMHAPDRTWAPATTLQSAAVSGVWFLVATVVAIAFGDRVGWEGDDLAQIFGATHLDVLGVENVYRYYWQPLSYELMHELARLGLRPLSMTVVSNVAGVTGLFLLGVLVAARAPGNSRAKLVAPLLILAVPELWLTALYFNTTALGLPFFVGSLCLLAGSGSSWRAFAAGLLLGIACLFRFDFAVACPFVAAWLLYEVQGMRWHTFAFWVLGGAFAIVAGIAICAPGLVTGIIAVGLRFEDGQQAWGLHLSLKVLLAAVGPVLVILPACIGLRPLATAVGTLLRTRALMLASMAPMLLPFKNLYSGKYIVPLLVCVFVLIGGILQDPAVRSTMSAWRIRAAWVLLAATWIIGLPASTSGSTGWANVLSSPRLFMTHDGYRTFGGYAHLMGMLRSGKDRPEQLQTYLDLVSAVDVPGARVALVLPADPSNELNNSWKWGWIPVHLESRGWQLAQWGKYEAAELIDCRDQRKLMIVSSAVSRTDAVRELQLVDMQGAAASKHVELTSSLTAPELPECSASR